jgi:AraC-type transcriptional regulator
LARRYVHLENSTVLNGIEHKQNEVALVHNVLAILRPRATQFLNALVALTVRVSRIMPDSAWNAVRIELTAARPASTDIYQQFFRCPVQFEAQRNVIVVRREDFERPLPQGNPELLAFFRIS